MTKEDILKIAQECNLIGMRPHLDGIYSESLEAFAKLVAEKEREACATIVDEVIDFWVKAGYPECAEVRESMNIYELIRARKQE